jgi:hypothetical protein
MFVTSLTVYSKSWFRSVREENDTMVEVKPALQGTVACEDR